MKILVIDDNAGHRAAAIKALASHDLTVVSSFDEAIEAMSTEVDYEVFDRLRKEANLGCFPQAADEATKKAWKEKYQAFEQQSVKRPQFDVVLTDMNLPMSPKTLTEEVFKPHEEVPYGFVLALRATQIGVKYVAMVTDANHHLGAMSAALDNIGRVHWYSSKFEPPFEINGAKVFFAHSPLTLEEVNGVEIEQKDWGTVLTKLVADPSTTAE